MNETHHHKKQQNSIKIIQTHQSSENQATSVHSAEQHSSWLHWMYFIWYDWCCACYVSFIIWLPYGYFTKKVKKITQNVVFLSFRNWRTEKSRNLSKQQRAENWRFLGKKNLFKMNLLVDDQKKGRFLFFLFAVCLFSRLYLLAKKSY